METGNAQDVEVMEMLPLKPWQRLAANLFASGMPFHEISGQVNQPVVAISGFITSRQGQGLVNQALTMNIEQLDSMLQAAAVDTILTLIKIRDTSDKDTTRVSACKTILDKILPSVRPKDKSLRKGLESTDPESEIKRLREMLSQA